SGFSGTLPFTPDISKVSYTFTDNTAATTVGAGSGAQSSTEGPLQAGGYKFDATFAGDRNYQSTGSGDEPLTINQGTLTLNTTIYDSGGTTPPSGTLGESVHDKSSFSGTLPFTPDITKVSYTFTDNTAATTVGAGSGAQSSTEGPLQAGGYKFDATFAGDRNYQSTGSGDEPLTINQGTLTLNTTIYDSGGTTPPSGTLGESVYDKSSFSGT